MKQFIQISSGKGPEECCFAVAQVLKKIIKSCKAADCYYEVIQREPSSINGNLKSAAMWVNTKNNPTILKEWIGTIQWVSESPFRVHHKRKNWFIGVNAIENAAVKELNLKEVSYEAIRSSGPGGQHVNKVSSAVRAIHKPSGLNVKVMDTRSQIQNKRLATERLAQLWDAHQVTLIEHANSEKWNNHLKLERGNPIKVFKSKDFKLKAPIKKFKNQRMKEKQSWKRSLE